MKRLRLFAASVVCAGSVAPAHAAPTYLICSITRPGGTPIQVNITADEAAQQVTVAIPSTGHSERLQAVFSASTVEFGSRTRFSKLHYVLSRTDLSLVRTLTIGADQSPPDRGICKVEATPKRAF